MKIWRLYGKAVQLVLTGIACLALVSCHPEMLSGLRRSDLHKDVELQTVEGSIVLRLSAETPLHRNRFLQLVKNHELDSTNFYRIVANFVIQSGTKEAEERTDNMIAPEFRPQLFHKRGALGAARMFDDVNPTRSSSNMHFYIVQGKVQNDSLLRRAENRINYWWGYNRARNDAKNAPFFARYRELSADTARAAEFAAVNTEADSLAKAARQQLAVPYVIPEAQRAVYKTLGGAPHLDQNYTVFGEVIRGMEVVDRIAARKTRPDEQPFEKAWIIKAVLIDRE